MNYLITAEQRLEAMDALYLPSMKTEAMLKQKDKAYVMLQSLAPVGDSTHTPVAWAMRRADGLVLDVICPDEHDRHEGEYTLPLFTHPAPLRTPLTKTKVGNYLRKQLSGDSGQYCNGFKDGVRFAEKHHGIGGEK